MPLVGNVFVPALSAAPSRAAPCAGSSLQVAATPAAVGSRVRGHCSSAAPATLSAVLCACAAGRAAGRRNRRGLGSRCGVRSAVALRAGVESESTIVDSGLDEVYLREIFTTAASKPGSIQFDEAVRLEMIDDALAEGATDLGELMVLWGEDEQPLSFEDFSTWYMEVSSLREALQYKDAVTPSDDLLEDEYDYGQSDGLDMSDVGDEDLLTDRPAMGETIKETLDNKEAEDAEEQLETQEALKRSNKDIAKLFREQCTPDNMLSIQGLYKITEISEMLFDGEVTKLELRELWEEIKQKNKKIDILGFRELLVKIDALFEYVEDELDYVLSSDEARRAKAQLPDRELPEVRQEFMSLVKKKIREDEQPCGLSGTVEQDGPVADLSRELEYVWRKELDVDNFDIGRIAGDWELIYTTSPKFRRWRTLFDTSNLQRIWPPSKGWQFETIIQTFTLGDDTVQQLEYDIEEVHVMKGVPDSEAVVGFEEGLIVRGEGDGPERAARGFGTWDVIIQDNVVNGLRDLVLKLDVQSAEFDNDKEENEKIKDEKLRNNEILGVFGYTYLCYVDKDIRVMRTSLGGNGLFVFKRLKDDTTDQIVPFSQVETS